MTGLRLGALLLIAGSLPTAAQTPTSIDRQSPFFRIVELQTIEGCVRSKGAVGLPGASTSTHATSSSHYVLEDTTAVAGAADDAARDASKRGVALIGDAAAFDPYLNRRVQVDGRFVNQGAAIREGASSALPSGPRGFRVAALREAKGTCAPKAR